MKAAASAVACILALSALTSARSVQEPQPEEGAKYGAKAVTRVIDLLSDLQKRIKADAKADKKVYDKFGCWCVTNAAEKADSIAHVKAQLQTMGATVMESKGSISTLTNGIAELTTDLKDNEESMHEATKIRQRQNENYVIEKAETDAAIGALSKALQVLDIVQGGTGAAMTLGSEELIQQVKAVRPLVQAKASARQLEALDSFAQQGYVPKSASIANILQDMYETFAHDLAATSEREHSLQENYDLFLAEKSNEMKTLQSTILKKESEKGDSENFMSESTKMYDAAEKQLQADIEFFDASKAACTAKATEWTERQTVRNEELDGITKAISILVDESAQYTFGASMKDGGFEGASFVQTSKTINTDAMQAFKALQKCARESHSMRLAALAADVRVAAGKESPLHTNGYFDLIGKSIDKLVVEIVQEQKDDNVKVDECVQQLHEINLAVHDVEWKISNNDAEINKLEALIVQKESEKTATVAELEKVMKDITDLNATRANEQNAFETGRADDQAAIALLTQARNALMTYYEKYSAQEGAALVQTHRQPQGASCPSAEDVCAGIAQCTAGCPCPTCVGDVPQEEMPKPIQLNVQPAAPAAEFKTSLYRHNDAKGVEGTIAIIIQDLERQITTSEAGEVEAQATYDKQLASAQTLKKDLQTEMTNLNEAISMHGQEKVRFEGIMESNKDELQTQQNTETDIRPRCDFLINKKDNRRSKRDAELEALKQAKRYLKGAGSREAFVQKSPSFLQRHS